MTQLISTAAICTLLFLAAASDIRTRKIPKVLTVTGFLVALVLRSMEGGAVLVDGLQGAVMAFAVVLPFFALGALGGGDLKLLVAVGAFTGVSQFLMAFVATALLGVVLAVVETARKGALPLMFANTQRLGMSLLKRGGATERATIASPGAITVPYGVAIALGTLIVWFFLPVPWSA